MLDSAAKIIRDAVKEIVPTHIVSMVSGGKDSAASDAVVKELGLKIDLTIHGNTRTGIPETTKFVEQHYSDGDFAVADAGTAYEDYVLRKGFFGKGRSAHGFSYRVLKATPFRKTISHCIRKGKRDIRILLINGARKAESANREKRLPIMRADPAAKNNVWVNPIHFWTASERNDYLDSRNVPINPVAQVLCRSGECMCGTMQTKEQRAEAALFYPDWGKWLDSLEAEAQRKHGFGWGSPFSDQQKLTQLDLFQPMCIGCTRETGAVTGCNDSRSNDGPGQPQGHRTSRR